MAISGQNLGETDVTTEELRDIYDNVIKAALENADLDSISFELMNAQSLEKLHLIS